jgi:hypothetical protein
VINLWLLANVICFTRAAGRCKCDYGGMPLEIDRRSVLCEGSSIATSEEFPALKKTITLAGLNENRPGKGISERKRFAASSQIAEYAMGRGDGSMARQDWAST